MPEPRPDIRCVQYLSKVHLKEFGPRHGDKEKICREAGVLNDKSIDASSSRRYVG